MTMTRRIALAAVLLLGPAAARAAGPLLVNGAGTPLVWTANPIPFNPDLGTLGTLSNASAVAAVTANFNVWTAVATSTVSYTNTGPMPVNVTAANYTTYLGACGDGLNPIIFDTDGSITDDAFGAGASNSILGFAGPDCATFVPPVITEGVAVLNGKFVDGINAPGNPEISLTNFNAVFIHEFGHYANLDHSQINLLEAFDGDPGNDDAVATMFPILINGTEASTLSLDDEVSISTLYPDPSFASGFGTITGSIYRTNGTTLFQGAYVIARLVGDPRLTAVGVASGARYFPANAGGPPAAALQGRYEIPGLPAGSYTVEVEEIDSGFTGGSSVGPLSPPAVLPGPPEFYNGGSEAGSDPPDDPASSTTLAVAAAGTQSGIDIVLNGFPPPANDDCSAPTVIPSLPYTDSGNTAGANTAVSDPLQSCTFGGPSQNSASVWYTYTAASATTLVATTNGSGYDTIVTVHTGSCGSLAELACDDDSGVGLQSRVVIAVGAGQTVRFEVTGFDGVGGGPLVFNVSESVTYPGGYADPSNDTLGTGSPQVDLMSLSGCSGSGTTRITLGFFTPISPGDSGDPDALQGYVELDTDQNAATGAPPLNDSFSGFASGLGVEYVVNLFSTNSGTGTVDVLDQFGGFVGTAAISFGSASVTIGIPLSVLGGDDGSMNFAALIGTAIEPTDAAPNGGNVATVGCTSLACPTTPRTDCRQPTAPGKASIQIKNDVPEKDQLKWKWKKGQATSKEDFGAPTTSTEYVACLYDEVAGTPALKLTANIPPGGTCAGKPCWKETSTTFKYSNKTFVPNGIQSLLLKAGIIDGKASISLGGKGGDLGLPALPFAQNTKVIFQLQGNGFCWDAEYSAPATKNQTDRFQDKGD